MRSRGVTEKLLAQGLWQEDEALFNGCGMKKKR